MIEGLARYLVAGWRRLFSTFRPAMKRVSHSPHEVRLLLGSMVAVSAADGSLSDSAISLIQAVAHAALDMDVGRKHILDAFHRFREVDFVSEISPAAGTIAPGVAELALKCAVIVARADGELSDAEFLMIYRIAAALGLPRRRTSLCIEEGRALLESFRPHPAGRPGPAGGGGPGD